MNIKKHQLEALQNLNMLESTTAGAVYMDILAKGLRRIPRRLTLETKLIDAIQQNLPPIIRHTMPFILP